ncbi:ketoreductase domain-containing protein [Bacillus amyloliquefaciens]|nr:ketoreductase domain-containing protein [Bacillus amyloliquefaciens]WOH97328.1 ketoreductase domain-containing protein [Bacillus amyloliquefaciens]
MTCQEFALGVNRGRSNGWTHNYILNQTENERKTVMAPKVKGLINLDEAAKDVRLDFFILFSSLAGGMGNPGQAGYAAANAFMDVYAARRNRLVRDNKRSGQTLSVNWPLYNYILNQTENERKTVMAPKVKGLINLDEAAKDARLDFFILFSSLAGGMGNPGQAGYAAANAFMDVYAARRNRLVRDNKRSGQTLSVNWPLSSCFWYPSFS